MGIDPAKEIARASCRKFHLSQSLLSKKRGLNAPGWFVAYSTNNEIVMLGEDTAKSTITPNCDSS
jgi:hypothetical protein